MTVEKRFSVKEYGSLLAWFMASDPFPVEHEHHERIKRLLEDEATARNYDDWVHAYHDIHMEYPEQ